MDDVPASAPPSGSFTDIWSVNVGDRLRVFVDVCGPADAAELPWIFVTDANGTFSLTVDIVRHLQLGGHLPHMVIVGLGYPAAALSDTIERRSRDLSPTAWPMTADDGTVFVTGGADRFLDAIEHEVLPLVERRLPRASRRILYGHSLGGLFAIHAWHPWSTRVHGLHRRQPVDLVGRSLDRTATRARVPRRSPPARQPRRDGGRRGILIGPRCRRRTARSGVPSAVDRTAAGHGCRRRTSRHTCRRCGRPHVARLVPAHPT